VNSCIATAVVAIVVATVVTVVVGWIAFVVVSLDLSCVA